MADPSSPTPRFTLLGLVLVLVGIAATSAVVVPWWFGRAEVTLEAAARLLAEDVHDVQNRAALRGERLELRFAPDGSGYRATTAIGDDLESPMANGPFERHYPRDAVFRGVEIVRTRFEGGDRLAFGRAGECLWAGEIELAFEDERTTVRIEADTGIVRVGD